MNITVTRTHRSEKRTKFITQVSAPIEILTADFAVKLLQHLYGHTSGQVIDEASGTGYKISISGTPRKFKTAR